MHDATTFPDLPIDISFEVSKYLTLTDLTNWILVSRFYDCIITVLLYRQVAPFNYHQISKWPQINS
jgi:hypothetical protein